MRIVVALGGNALLKRGEAMTAENQLCNVKIAASALAELAKEHEIVIAHGNGPQVGLLALQAASYETVAPYPLDILGAESVGQIGYMIEQQMGNILPFEQKYATLLTQVEVDANDPAFADPTKFIGPVYSYEQADLIAKERGFTFKPDGEYYRRVVPSPLPKRIFEISVIEMLIEQGVIVTCAGGGGIPTMYQEDGTLTGVEAVIDKDRTASLLAREINADALLVLTDVDSVYLNWGTDEQKEIRTASTQAMSEFGFPAGSMGPKVEAAIEFAQATGGLACIGSLENAKAMLNGDAGTTVLKDCEQTVYA
ncbi:carbamate kinase [Thalassotalea sp. HSM 43]|uniref:carbamate kinase n=1 Tax=Thalassotalea sp. HSM 43 TaxID=2552945 RepID=UPI00107FD77B|nr:carbamate kinase [Thalassotalea sp. HSM 43]QBY04921.1 carbamate kinase [Thalassotalea sp. HSM 43]